MSKFNIFFFLQVCLIPFNYSYANKASLFKIRDISQSILFVESRFNKTRKTKLDATIGFNKHFSTDLQIKAKTKTYFEVGSSSSIYSAEFAPSSSIGLEEATLIYNPYNEFKLELGAINQNWINNTLLIDSIPFFSIKEKVILNLSSVELSLIAQQSIASNYELSNRLSSIENNTPVFLVFGLNIKNTNQLFKINLMANYFDFSNISSEVSFYSGRYGNSITNSTSKLTSQFLYNYQGLALSGSIVILPDSKIQPMIGFNYVYNEKAPSGRNNSLKLMGAIKINSLQVGGEYFKNESDSTIAYYNNSYYGHNNTKGFTGNIKKQFKKFSLALNLHSFEPIDNSNPFQAKTFLVFSQLSFKM